MNKFKRIDINEDLFVNDYGNNKFEVGIRTCAPTGVYIYRYENSRLKWFQRRSYAGVSSVKYFNFYK
jgi:hypothetical protein